MKYPPQHLRPRCEICGSARTRMSDQTFACINDYCPSNEAFRAGQDLVTGAPLAVRLVIGLTIIAVKLLVLYAALKYFWEGH